MGVQAYINFDGNAKGAVEFYAEVFNTDKPQIMLFGDMKSNDGYALDKDMKSRVLHAEIKIGTNTIMFSDIAKGVTLTVGNNITLIFNSEDEEEIKKIFSRLKEDGTVVMDLQKTFWSNCYGQVIDKFGIGWQLSADNKKL